jgi:prepilin-type processing-associated H-X9-DG protein
MELYIAYDVSVRDGQLELLEIRNAMPADLIQYYRIMATNGLSRVSTVCPNDSRKAGDSMANLQLTNISYFLSLGDPQLDDAEQILAGDRNIGEPGTFVRLRRNSGLTWRPELGLHGNRGNLLFRDGSVRATDEQALRAAIDKPANERNWIGIP